MTYRKIVSLFLLLTLTLCNLVSCSLEGKFSETQEINLAPFAENITVMANELTYGFNQIRTLHSKWYFDDNSQQQKRLLNLENLVTNEIIFIVKYSTRIVYLSESNLLMLDKTTELARFISKMYSRFSNSKTLSISKKQHDEIITKIKQQDEIITKIKQQDKFLSALQIAQPFINELARYSSRLLDQLKKSEKNLAFYQTTKIETENNYLKSLILSLKKNEQEITNTIVALQEYENGSKTAYKNLKKSNILRGKALIHTKKRLNEKQINVLKQFLLQKLTRNTNYFNQVEPSYKRYLLAQKEILSLVKEHDLEIRKTRMIFIAFASAHRKMSSGIVNPAKWFDIKKQAPKVILKLL